MQPEALAQLQNLIALDSDGRSQCVIGLVGVGNERVEAVVGTFQLDEDQQAAIVARCGAARRLCPDARCETGAGAESPADG